MALGDLLMLLGAESRNVSGLFKTMLEQVVALLEGACVFRLVFTTLAFYA